MPRAFARQAEFEKAVEQTALTLGPDVVKMIPELGYNWTGDPAVFLEVVLEDGIPPMSPFINESEYAGSQQSIPA